MASPPPDWSLIEAFLAVAETGSLSAAARQLRASQPTLGRRIARLERQLDADLFRRRARGYALTVTGEGLLSPARAMREAMRQIALAAAGQQGRLEGTVRITASTMFAAYHLPPMIAGLRHDEPRIALEIVASDSATNLLYREADIAVRMFRPTQGDLVTRHIGDLPLALYAHESYIAAHGRPDRPEDLMQHRIIGFDRDPAILEGFAAMGFPVGRDFFGLRCDDNIVNWRLTEAGCGIGFCQRSIGAAAPGVVEIDLGLPLPSLPVWLTAHEAMRATPRIRRVWEALDEGLSALVAGAGAAGAARAAVGQSGRSGPGSQP